MDQWRAAAALLALAACFVTTIAAPTSNQTALDLYEGSTEGCYYNFQHYGEGDRIMTNEPCLNCTCHNRMLMCYLKVCPFTKAIGQDCTVEKRADQCCPIVTCPDVPVDLLTSTSTSSPAEYGATGIGKLDKYGCSINNKYFPEGSKVPSTPNKPCEHCYCIRNMTTCVMQECTLHVDGCTPIYHKDVCCPIRYSCDHPEDEIPLLDDMTTTVRPTPGFLLTTTTMMPVTQTTQNCVHDDQIFADGALIKTEKACEHCYCMKGDIVCVVQECGTPMENEGKNCTSIPPRHGQCCPDTYICEGDEIQSEPAQTSLYEDITTTSPPRRVAEGSGYRNEPGEPITETGIFENENEGSGEELSLTTSSFDTTTIKNYTPERTSEITGLYTDMDKNLITAITGKVEEDIHDSTESILPSNTIPDTSRDTITSEPRATTLKVDEHTLQETTEVVTSPTEPFSETLVAEGTTTPKEHLVTDTSLDKSTQLDEEFLLATKLPSDDILAETTSNLSNDITTEKLLETEQPSKIDNTSQTESPKLLVSEVTPTSTDKINLPDITTINTNENEIIEDESLGHQPGRIPGEGDCLLGGITYRNNSNVPTSSKCHSSCRCVSSIIKCDPIVCTPPLEYMENMNDCEPIYDSADSCCPTYVCNTKETTAPESHSQMSGTETSKPTLECKGDECHIIESPKPSTPIVINNENCGENGCIQENVPKCNDDKCGIEIEKPIPEKCTSEVGCQVPVVKPCEDDNCHPQEVTPESTKKEVQNNICDDDQNCENLNDERDESAICTNNDCRRKEHGQIELNVPCIGDSCTKEEDSDQTSNTFTSLQQTTPKLIMTSEDDSKSESDIGPTQQATETSLEQTTPAQQTTETSLEQTTPKKVSTNEDESKVESDIESAQPITESSLDQTTERKITTGEDNSKLEPDIEPAQPTTESSLQETTHKQITISEDDSKLESDAEPAQLTTVSSLEQTTQKKITDGEDDSKLEQTTQKRVITGEDESKLGSDIESAQATTETSLEPTTPTKITTGEDGSKTEFNIKPAEPTFGTSFEQTTLNMLISNEGDTKLENDEEPAQLTTETLLQQSMTTIEIDGKDDSKLVSNSEPVQPTTETSLEETTPKTVTTIKYDSKLESEVEPAQLTTESSLEQTTPKKITTIQNDSKLESDIEPSQPTTELLLEQTTPKKIETGEVDSKFESDIEPAQPTTESPLQQTTQKKITAGEDDSKLESDTEPAQPTTESSPEQTTQKKVTTGEDESKLGSDIESEQATTEISIELTMPTKMITAEGNSKLESDIEPAQPTTELSLDQTTQKNITTGEDHSKLESDIEVARATTETLLEQTTPKKIIAGEDDSKLESDIASAQSTTELSLEQTTPKKITTGEDESKLEADTASAEPNIESLLKLTTPKAITSDEDDSKLESDVEPTKPIPEKEEGTNHPLRDKFQDEYTTVSNSDVNKYESTEAVITNLYHVTTETIQSTSSIEEDSAKFEHSTESPDATIQLHTTELPELDNDGKIYNEISQDDSKPEHQTTQKSIITTQEADLDMTTLLYKPSQGSTKDDQPQLVTERIRDETQTDGLISPGETEESNPQYIDTDSVKETVAPVNYDITTTNIGQSDVDHTTEISEMFINNKETDSKSTESPIAGNKVTEREMTTSVLLDIQTKTPPIYEEELKPTEILGSAEDVEKHSTVVGEFTSPNSITVQSSSETYQTSQTFSDELDKLTTLGLSESTSHPKPHKDYNEEQAQTTVSTHDDDNVLPGITLMDEITSSSTDTVTETNEQADTEPKLTTPKDTKLGEVVTPSYEPEKTTLEILDSDVEKQTEKQYTIPEKELYTTSLPGATEISMEQQTEMVPTSERIRTTPSNIFNKEISQTDYIFTSVGTTKAPLDDFAENTTPKTIELVTKQDELGQKSTINVEDQNIETKTNKPDLLDDGKYTTLSLFATEDKATTIADEYQGTKKYGDEQQTDQPTMLEIDVTSHPDISFTQEAAITTTKEQQLDVTTDSSNKIVTSQAGSESDTDATYGPYPVTVQPVRVSDFTPKEPHIQFEQSTIVSGTHVKPEGGATEATQLFQTATLEEEIIKPTPDIKPVETERPMSLVTSKPDTSTETLDMDQYTVSHDLYSSVSMQTKPDENEFVTTEKVQYSIDLIQNTATHKTSDDTTPFTKAPIIDETPLTEYEKTSRKTTITDKDGVELTLITTIPQTVVTEKSSTEYITQAISEDVTTPGTEYNVNDETISITDNPIIEKTSQDIRDQPKITEITYTTDNQYSSTSQLPQEIVEDSSPKVTLVTKSPQSLTTEKEDILLNSEEVRTTLSDDAFTNKPITTVVESSTSIEEGLRIKTTSDASVSEPHMNLVTTERPISRDRITTETEDQATISAVLPDEIKTDKYDDLHTLQPFTSEDKYSTHSPEISDQNTHAYDITTTKIPEESPTESIEIHVADTELPEELETKPFDNKSTTQGIFTTKEPGPKDIITSIEVTTESKYQDYETTPYFVELEEHTHVIPETSVTPVSDISTEELTEIHTTERGDQILSDEKLQGDLTTEEPHITTSKYDSSTTVLYDSKLSTISPQKVTVKDTAVEEEKQETIAVYLEPSTSTQLPVQNEEGLISMPIETEKPLYTSTESDKTSIDNELPKEESLETKTPYLDKTTMAPDHIMTSQEETTMATISSKIPDVKPEEKPAESITSTFAPVTSKPVMSDVQPTEDLVPDFPPTGVSGYGQEPDYVEEDQAFGPGTCRYGGKVYVSAQQIPRDDPCDFCFCFRSDIICLQQSCPPPIHGCHEEPIQGFCCPRYECPVSMATTLNVTTTTTTTTTTLPPHFLPHAYKGAAQRRGCQIKGHSYKVGEVVRSSSGPCLHCTCGGDGQMKCDPKVCTPEPMLRQMIAAAVSARRRR
ncbi:uncharacterized protein LOC126966911 isoform X2 [Leptidea sinapis]|uniref:uncharacterized protein LOC126966911 isoform X2 n=1 Tax=Leptidea sinapis TaxID=189913 RepID=UPI0021C2CCAF|nr:uncharacterized protein LOC126966911 isoform X2 [Leptidea sinapis]